MTEFDSQLMSKAPRREGGFAAGPGFEALKG